MKDEVRAQVPIGNPADRYQLGHFLRAVDCLALMFIGDRPRPGSGLHPPDIADALEMYALQLRCRYRRERAEADREIAETQKLGNPAERR